MTLAGEVDIARGVIAETEAQPVMTENRVCVTFTKCVLLGGLMVAR